MTQAQQLFLALYVALALAAAIYHFVVKFRHRVRETCEFVTARTFLIYLLTALTYAAFLTSLVQNSGFLNLEVIDYINIIFAIGLLLFAKAVSYRVDIKYKDVKEIIEASDYGLIRKFCINVILFLSTLYFIYLDEKENWVYFILCIYPISYIADEVWERILSIRLWFRFRSGGMSKNRRLAELFEKSPKEFWFREIAGNIAKTTVNCWLSFSMLVLITHKYFENIDDGSIEPLRYEGVNYVINVTESFYISASELYFGASGVFPHSGWAQIVFFFMHVVGLFLYSIFLVIAIQAYQDPDNGSDEESGAARPS